MKEFDLLSAKLEGCQLIEASAGTGKTFTITRIFLRLLLAGYALSEIVLVSFTLAATQELRERIRRTLQEALAVLQAHALESDINQILQAHSQAHSQVKASLCIERIEEALSNFDQINVYTIHSFCNQILEEQSFGSGLLPGYTICSDNEDKLGRELILDFWRRHLQNAPRLFLEFLISIDFSVEEWCQSFSHALVPEDWTLPAQAAKVVTSSDLQKYSKEAEAAFCAFQKLWPKQKAEALDFFRALRKQSGRQEVTVNKIIQALEEHFQKQELHLFAWDIEEKIFNLHQKKEGRPSVAIQNSFSKQWEAYRQKYEDLVHALRDHLFFYFSKLKESYSEELDQKKPLKLFFPIRTYFLKPTAPYTIP